MQTSQAQNLTESIPGMLYGSLVKADIEGSRVADATRSSSRLRLAT
jgi:hypothetical protein